MRCFCPPSPQWTIGGPRPALRLAAAETSGSNLLIGDQRSPRTIQPSSQREQDRSSSSGSAIEGSIVHFYSLAAEPSCFQPARFDLALTPGTRFYRYSHPLIFLQPEHNHSRWRAVRPNIVILAGSHRTGRPCCATWSRHCFSTNPSRQHGRRRRKHSDLLRS